MSHERTSPVQAMAHGQTRAPRMMARMDFLYGVVPALLLVVGILLAWLCLRRVFSLRLRAFSTVRKIAEGIVLSLIALVVLALGLNSAVNAVILHHYRAQMPGALYVVDGHRMRLDCTGSGSPTLVLDAGLGNDGLIFSAVQPTLAKTTRVCSYDRAGMGWSDPVSTPRDADHIADQLHGLLQAAGISGPIVLMGHSIAGMYIRDYATRYPGQVAGLIFIDASTPWQNRDPALSKAMRPGGPPLRVRLLTQAMFVLGIPRWMSGCSQPFPAFDPARAKLQAEERCHLVVSSPAGESTNFDRSGKETIHTGPYGDLPVLVFTSDPALAAKFHEPSDMRAAWDRMQANLKNLSTHSRQIIAANAGHYIQLDRAGLINREVPIFIQQIRGTAPPPAVWGTTTTE
ncbi:MAG TPA: alpha/beta hydrolase [Acidobacteriaceae bacterium]|jgi:pimeloyl-ACP methyl ester carboxylesterase|nr:alpha/beta hydrolase [Acidobacteriaceae bacterium]